MKKIIVCKCVSIHWPIYIMYARYVYFNQGGMGHWTVYYTSPQSLRITFFLLIGFTTFGTFLLNFNWLVHLVACPNVSTTNSYCRCGCTSIYRPLSYPFRSMILIHYRYSLNSSVCEREENLFCPNISPVPKWYILYVEA